MAAIGGRYCQLEPLATDHIDELYAANREDLPGRMWDYLPVGPFASLQDYAIWVEEQLAQDAIRFFAIRAEDGRASGVASYLRIAPQAGSIEVGYISYSPRLQRTRAGSEAIILMAQHAFSLGYRRFEWKCNALNRSSRRAAQRFGFSYEGVFRQAAVVKGRNRDTAWFAMIDREAEALDKAWTDWLDPTNFDADGQQIRSLRDYTRPILVAEDPTEK